MTEPAHSPGLALVTPDAGEASPRRKPDSQGPGERLRGVGPAALSNAELLALLLGGAGRSGLRIARLLARRHPSELGQWPWTRYRVIAGLPPERADALVAAFELGRRAHDAPVRRSPIRGPEDVLPHVRDLTRARREHFVVLLLNARHELDRRETVSIGSLNASIVHPREVFLPAILHSAASLVLVHNHPSGDPEPSEEDLSITRRLLEVGELVGIGVLDHVIVASRGTVSFRARQLL